MFIFKDGGVYTQLHYWLQLNVEFKGRPSKQFHLLCDKTFKFSSIFKKDSWYNYHLPIITMYLH